MGAYLSSPVTEKESFEKTDGTVLVAGAAMQGWRRTMEDAHMAVLSQEIHGNKVSLFGVFDGHGGGEVAAFCAKHMPEQVAKLAEIRDHGDLGQGLVKLFHRMDEMLRSEVHSAELADFRGKRSDDEDSEAALEEAPGNNASPNEAIDLLKRFFAMKRQGNGSEPNGSAPQDRPEQSQGSTNSGPQSALATTEFAVVGDDMQEDNLPEHSIQAGCTAVVALLKDNRHLYIANAGDSRAVLCRKGTALALSEDHKPAQDRERKRIEAAGGFLSEIGGVCRVNGNLNLSRAIGDLKYKANEALSPSAQIITAEPDVRHVEITQDDRFLVLACDGVWDVLDNQQVCDFVAQGLGEGKTPKQVACDLLDSCLASNPRDAKGIGCDNMTAQIVVLNNSS